jgi:hypothetical protein
MPSWKRLLVALFEAPEVGSRHKFRVKSEFSIFLCPVLLGIINYRDRGKTYTFVPPVFDRELHTLMPAGYGLTIK